MRPFFEKSPIASLPWYDFPEVRWATDALWGELAKQFRFEGLADVPDGLNRDISYERQWRSPGFLFGQACGYDVRISCPARLQVITTPCYAATGCEQHNYSSWVIVREDSQFERVEDLRHTRCVVNTPTSHSGMNVLRALVAPLHDNGRFFAEVRMSGSHERSLQMVRRGQVDVAAIDCVTYELLKRHRPHELADTRVLHHTELVPCPPYVTARSTSPETLAAMRRAIARALAEPALAPARKALLLSGVELLEADAYHQIESLRSVAHDHNYHEIPGDEVVVG